MSNLGLLQDRNSVLGIITKFSPFIHVLTVSVHVRALHIHTMVSLIQSLLYRISNKMI